MRPFPAVVRAVRWLASLPLHLCPALRAPIGIASVRYLYRGITGITGITGI